MRIPPCLRLAGAIAMLQQGSTCATPPQEYPFEFHDGLIWVQIHPLNSSAPLNFLLDSGAGVSALNTSTAQRLGIQLGRPVAVQGVQQKTTGFWPQHLAAASNSLALPRNLLCVDLNALGDACACTLDGLLGADFFHDHTVQIDFVSRKIRLSTPGGLAGCAQSIVLRAQHRALLAPVRINGGSTQWVRLDTGCAGALHWVDSKVASVSGNSRMAVAFTPLCLPHTQTVVRLGTADFQAIPTDMHDRRIFAGEDGLLGNGILSRFESVTVDARSRRLLLE